MLAQLVGTYNLSPPSGARAATDADEESFGTLEGLFAAGARGMVEAQQALDEEGRARLLIWETEGLPPTVWTCSNCRLKFPAAFRVEPKADASRATRVHVAPRADSRGGVSISFRYVLNPQEEL
jgi:hypothetical protein